MTGTLRRIQKAGYRPLLAHPERYRYLTEPGYERLHKMGVHFQMNLGSLVGYYGETAMGKAHDLLEKGWYSEVGSDCHRLATIQEQYTREVLTKDIASRLSLTNRH
jgi:tyrosine-protein phosphatase YwqE